MNRQNKFVGKPRHAVDLRWQRKVAQRLDALLNALIQDERGNNIGTVQYADGNTIFKFAASSGNSEISAFAITELGHEDYFVARELSNVRLVAGVPTADVGAVDVKIAKVKNVRRSILTQSLFGDTVTFTDDTSDIDNTRVANNGTDNENQVCIPPYIAAADLGLSDTVPMNSQCVVYAKKLAGLTGVFDDDGAAIDWLEDAGSDGVRVFAKRYTP